MAKYVLITPVLSMKAGAIFDPINGASLDTITKAGGVYAPLPNAVLEAASDVATSLYNRGFPDEVPAQLMLAAYGKATSNALASAGNGNDMLYGGGTINLAEGGGTLNLSIDKQYNDITLSGSDLIYTAGYKVFCKGTLTLNAGTNINNDGAQGIDQSGGTGKAGGGTTLGNSGCVGGAGGGTSSNGQPGNNLADAVGARGGKGGDSTSNTGSTAAVLAPPTNPWVWDYGLRKCTINIFLTDYAMQPGTGGGGSAGSPSTAGKGGGQAGGMTWLSAKNIVMKAGSRISARGGAGQDNTGGAGGSGGGGGGVVVIWCDSFTGPNGANDFSLVDANGGVGGVATGGGTNGENGDAGKVLIFVKGVLALASGFLSTCQTGLTQRKTPHHG